MKRTVILLVLPLLLVACGEKLNDAQKSGLSLAALAAKEQAAAFDLLKEKIKPNAEGDALPLKNYLASHGKGLNAQAAGLADLVKAIQSGSLLSDQTRKMLAEEAKTSAARARNFELARPAFKVDPELADFLDSHAAALKAQAQAMLDVANLFPPKPEKAQAPPKN